MLLSLEIPIHHLNEFLNLTDLKFGLAQLVLDKDQVGYRQSMKGCLLDNGMYELGESLSSKELIGAAALIEPSAIIAPDWMDDMQGTLAATVDLLALKPVKAEWTVGGVVQGKNTGERVDCFMELQRMDCKPICFPFRTPRDETVGRLLDRSWVLADGWYHLLGLQQLSELSWKFPGMWSIDTGKPFKGSYMNMGSIRGKGRLKLHGVMTDKERYIALWNICYMRRLMNG